MRKKIIAKGNVRRGDFMRAVVTDTLPEEVPIIFSNDGFYRNMSKNIIKNAEANRFIETLLTPDRSYTKPYRYSVLRDNMSTRGLSLIHPSSQYDVSLFYRKYDSLICHFCQRSDMSLRSPVKVGTTFFVKGSGSDRNRFKQTSIDTVSIETSVSNPASYFSYNYFSRAHQFFDSNEYLRLEKRFHIFRSIDVSKCFNSMYTHTLYWAIDGVHAAKENTSSVGFANEFDRLMQSMNYNETNGICIGPEVSRVFAEIIFSEIDRRIISYCSERNLKLRDDYDFRRYVDDYYVFSHNQVVSDKVTAAIEACLSDFNLHINESKTVTLFRPFATKKSQIVSDANESLNIFFDKIIKEARVGDSVVAIPKKVYRPDALLRFLSKRIKAICSNHGATYETVSDYVVSALSKRVTDLCVSFEDGAHDFDDLEENYVSIFMLLLEAIYFFYTVNPTVRASLYVARASIISTRLFRERYFDRLPFLSESIVRWTLDLAKSISRSEKHKDLTAVPVEVLNVLIPMKEIAEEEILVDDFISGLCVEIDHFGYFEIVTFLFLFGGRGRHRTDTNRLFSKAKDLVSRGLSPRVDSQVAHISLDLLACPFLPLEKRASWFNTLRTRCGLPKLPRAVAQEAIADMARSFWFVRWDRVDLLAQLRKKELSPIY